MWLPIVTYYYFWQDPLFIDNIKTTKERTDGRWGGQSSGQRPDISAFTECAKDWFPAWQPAAPVTNRSVVLLDCSLLLKWDQRLDKNRECRSQFQWQGRSQDWRWCRCPSHRCILTIPTSPPAQRKGTQNKPYLVSSEMENVLSSFRHCYKSQEDREFYWEHFHVAVMVRTSVKTLKRPPPMCAEVAPGKSKHDPQEVSKSGPGHHDAPSRQLPGP